mgnify:CR=1 FL=1
MRFKVVDENELNEKFRNDALRNQHHQKHGKDKKYDYDSYEVFHGISDEEYEALADELANSKVDFKNVDGFISTDANGAPSFCKWHKATGYLVFYDREGYEPIIRSFRVEHFRDYNRKRASRYADELPESEIHMDFL